MKTITVVEINRQVKSVWLSDGRRLGFAAARKLGLDVEAAQVGTVVA